MRQNETNDLFDVAASNGEVSDGSEITDARLLAIPSYIKALNFAISMSNMSAKAIYGPLRLTASQFSKYTSESDPANFPGEKEIQLERLIGNNLLSRWKQLQAGCGIYRLRTTVEEENAELKKKVNQLERDLARDREIFATIGTGRGGA